MHISRKQQLKGLNFKEQLNPVTRTGRSKRSSRTLMNKPNTLIIHKKANNSALAKPETPLKSTRNSATVQDSPNVFPAYSFHFPARLQPTRYEKGTSFPTDCEIRRLEEPRQEDRETEITSRCFFGEDPRPLANPHRKWGFSTELCKGKVKSRRMRDTRRFLCTHGRGCLVSKQKLGAKFTGF